MNTEAELSARWLFVFKFLCCFFVSLTPQLLVKRFQEPSDLWKSYKIQVLEKNIPQQKYVWYCSSLYDRWIDGSYIENVYFFQGNTKYISSNGFKISVISRVRSTSEISDIFHTRWNILVLTEKKVNFLYFFCLGEITANELYQNNFFPSHFSLILLGSACLLGIILGVITVCT